MNCSEWFRLLQQIIVIISLIVSALTTKLNQTITSKVELLNKLLPSVASYNVTVPQEANIVALVSSGITVLDKSSLMADFVVGETRNTNKASFYKRNRYFRSSSNKSLAFSLPLGSFFHVSSIMTTEAVENLAWLGSTILGLIKTGDWNCNDPNSLIENYNLTLGSRALDQFVNNLGLDLDITSKEAGLSRDPKVIQDELLLNLNGNCQLNKANIAISVIVYFLYMFTTGIMVQSFILFTRKYGEVDGLVELSYESPFVMPAVKKKVITVKEIEEVKEPTSV